MAGQRYHHGDLRGALVRAGLGLVEREGPAGVSLRAVAREIGVSQAAPYAHFEGKRDLMSCIAAAGFEQLRDRLAEASPRGLREIGLAYVDFAVTHPGLYSLMFGSNEDVDPHHPEILRASREAFAPLTRETVPQGGDTAVDPAPIAAWALVHGFAMLVINEKLSPERRELLPEILKLLRPGIDERRG